MKLDASKTAELERLSLVERAELFASWAHEGQTRADKKTPYIDHPRAIVAILRGYEDSARITDSIITSAWLHDTVEDCDVTHKEIERFFGAEIAHTVRELTCIEENDARMSHERKTELLCQMARVMGDDAKWVKMADRFHNLQDVRNTWNPNRVKRYAEQGMKILEAMNPIPPYSNPLTNQLREFIQDLTKEEKEHATT